MSQTINIQIRPAEAEDVKADSKNLRLGRMYFLKNGKGRMEGPYYLEEYTDRAEFVDWFMRGMVYVAVSPLDNEIKLVNP